METLKQILPQEYSDNARVWIYQSNRPFFEKEILEINEQLLQFYEQWQAHGAPVKGWAKVVYGQFVVVMADEATTVVSGCSTDGMVRVIKSIEHQYSVNLFDRLVITFLVKDKIEMLPMGQVQYALDKGYITAETPLFDNTVLTKGEMLQRWMQPLKNTWLARKLQFPVVSE